MSDTTETSAKDPAKPDEQEDVAALKARLASHERDAAEQKAARAKAEKSEARAAGEIDKLVSRYEADLAAAIKERDSLAAEIEGIKRQSRQRALTEAVAAKIGVPVDPVLIGLLPQTGEDIAPEKISDGHVARVAEAVRKLAPSLRPAQRAPGSPAGASPGPDPESDDFWYQRGASQSGRKA